MQDRTFTLVLCLLLVPWSLAVVLKSAGRLRARQPYVFAFWDGGMLMQDKQLGRSGTLAMLGFGAVAACVSVFFLGDVLG